MHLHRWRPVLLLAAAIPVLARGAPQRLDEAARLRNLGLAQLESDQPAEAEETFRRLLALMPADPLPEADLAVAELRLGRPGEALEAATRALARAGPAQRGDLLALRAEALAAGGRPGEALAALRAAAAAAPDRLPVQVVLWQQASGMGTADAAIPAGEALAAIVRLRPENLWAWLQIGLRAIEGGDRPGATRAYSRIRELLWRPPAAAQSNLDAVLADLDAATVTAARLPALRLANLLKATTFFQQSWRELIPAKPGTPLELFAAEPAAGEPGEPLPVRFRAVALATDPTAGGALATGDFDGDGRADVARITDGATPKLEIRLAARGLAVAGSLAAPPGLTGLVAVDLDNDGWLDLVGFGPGELVLWRGRGDGSFAAATPLAPPRSGAAAVAAVDYDLDGDLDLVTGSAGGLGLLRNSLEGPLTPVAEEAFPEGLARRFAGVREVVASDVDRDGYLDLLVAHRDGLGLLVNRRQGRFADRTAAAGLAGAGPVAALASADLDGDGFPDLVTAGETLAAWHNDHGRYSPWPLPGLAAAPRHVAALVAFDADNDGRLDLALAGEQGVAVLARRGGPGQPSFVPLPVDGAVGGVAAIAAADLDGDGDLDLVAAGRSGLYRLENLGGNRNHWLDVRLRALVQGSSKNNVFGLGSTAEVRIGPYRQLREVTSQVTHFGLGPRSQADVLRVVWTNGVPQDRLQPRTDQLVVEEQVLKGSCPFLFAWDGGGFRFVTDLLWGAPLGMPTAAGGWAGADPHELVRVDGARPLAGRYELRVTEELWEAAFFDQVRLWVVDHPAAVEVASNLRAAAGERSPVRVLASRGVRPVAAAWDGEGRDVTSRVRQRDEVYAAGYPPSRYQGTASRPWAFTLDLGEAPGRPVRLLLDGWIFPGDSSLNLAQAQRQDRPPAGPRLEVETAAGWSVLMPTIGLPAGKTKTFVLDTPPLPAGAHRLRIVSSLWLAWDRLAWTTTPADGEAKVVARLVPARAELAFRGFSAPVRVAPSAPHAFDYRRVTAKSPWLPFPGRYTRYGDVRELLLAADDRLVILAAGDELRLSFDAAALPAVPAGFRRTVLLESLGWDKDADRNTFAPEHLEPLPFRRMSGYPFAPGETYPDTPALRDYRQRWLTREVHAGGE